MLDTSSPENERDLREYLSRELSAFTQKDEVSRGVIDTIMHRSEGIFLYIRLICRELAERRLSLDRVEEFPQGLGEVYAQFFDRQFPLNRKDESGNHVSDAAQSERFRTKIRPVLEAIAAAQEPMELTFLASLFGWNEYAQIDFCRSLGSVFAVEDGRIRPFHPSVIEWLTNPHRAGDYFVSKVQGHRILAESGWVQYTDAVDQIAKYHLGHLPKHLRYVDETEHLRQILSDIRWLETKLKYRAIDELIQDYDLVDENDAIRLIQNSLRISRHALLTDRNQLRAQLIGRLGNIEIPAIQEFVRRMQADLDEGWWLLPRVATLRSPEVGVIHTWKAYDKAPPGQVVFSDDARELAFIEKKQVVCRTIDTGTVIAPQTVHMHFADTEWTQWQEAIADVSVGELLDGIDKHQFQKHWHVFSRPKNAEADLWVHWKREGTRYSQVSGPRFMDHIAQEVRLNIKGFRYWFESEAMPRICTSLCRSGNGRYFALAGLDGELIVWDLDSLEIPDADDVHAVLTSVGLGASPIFRNKHAGGVVSAMAVDGDGTQLAVLDTNGMLTVYRISDRETDAEPTPGVNTAGPSAVYVNPTGTRAFVIGRDESRTVWDTRTGTMLFQQLQDAELGRLHAVKVTEDIRFAVTIEPLFDMYDGFAISGVDLKKGKQVFQFETPGPKQNDGPWLPRNCTAGRGSYWVHPMPSGSQNPREAAVCTDLHTGCDEALDVIAVESAAPIGWYEQDDSAKPDLAVRISDDDWTVTLHLAKADESIASFTPDDVVTCVAVSADSSCVVVGCQSGQVHFLELIRSTKSAGHASTTSIASLALCRGQSIGTTCWERSS